MPDSSIELMKYSSEKKKSRKHSCSHQDILRWKLENKPIFKYMSSGGKGYEYIESRIKKLIVARRN